MINVVLWLGGIALLAVAIWNVRLPFARLGQLDQLAHNAKRYESWRGGRGSNPAAGDETTGADVMRQLLRRQVYLWSAVGGLGVLLLIGGFLVR